MADNYNLIIKSSRSQNYNIKSIDTNDIIGPMLDSGDDWYHLNERVGFAEGLYLLERILEETWGIAQGRISFTPWYFLLLSNNESVWLL